VGRRDTTSDQLAWVAGSILAIAIGAAVVIVLVLLVAGISELVRIYQRGARVGGKPAGLLSGLLGLFLAILAGCALVVVLVPATLGTCLAVAAWSLLGFTIGVVGCDLITAKQPAPDPGNIDSYLSFGEARQLERSVSGSLR
jgi:hypothetical protein